MKKLLFPIMLIMVFMAGMSTANAVMVNQAVKYVGPEMPDPEYAYDGVVTRVNANGKPDILVTVTVSPLVTQSKRMVSLGDPENPPATAYYYVE